jgi:hypothetical protein
MTLGRNNCGPHQELGHQMDPLSNGRRVELARNQVDRVSGPYGERSTGTV